MAKAMLFAVSITLAAAVSCMSSGAQGEPEPAVSVRTILVSFLHALAGDDGQASRALGWDASVDPCVWRGVVCDPSSGQVLGIFLEGLRGVVGLNGTIDATLLCAAAPALRVVSLRGNSLRGVPPGSIAGCAGLREISFRDNKLSGVLPASLSQLTNLRELDVSRNSFAGELPVGLGELRLVAFLLAAVVVNPQINPRRRRRPANQSTPSRRPRLRLVVVDPHAHRLRSAPPCLNPHHRSVVVVDPRR